MRRTDGFTLVEMLVALGVTSVVLGALATVVPTALRAREAATARLVRTTAATGVLSRLDRELATALRAPLVVEATPPHLAFTGGTEPGEVIGYTVERGALVRRAASRFAAAPDQTPGVRLLDDVARLELAVFDGRAWTRAWASDTLPVAVRVRVVFADGETLETVATIPTARPRRGA